MTTADLSPIHAVAMNQANGSIVFSNSTIGLESEISVATATTPFLCELHRTVDDDWSIPTRRSHEGRRNITLISRISRAIRRRVATTEGTKRKYLTGTSGRSSRMTSSTRSSSLPAPIFTYDPFTGFPTEISPGFQQSSRTRTARKKSPRQQEFASQDSRPGHIHSTPSQCGLVHSVGGPRPRLIKSRSLLPASMSDDTECTEDTPFHIEDSSPQPDGVFGRRRQQRPLSRLRNVFGRNRRKMPRKRSVKPKSGRLRAETVLLLATLLCVVLGTVLGLILNPLILGRNLSPRERYYLGFLGSFFMRMLKMLIIPMVVSSNVSSIASLNSMAARWLAALSVIYYMITTIIAVIVGIVAVLVIRPGIRRGAIANDQVHELGGSEKGSLKLADSVLDLIRNLVPENLVRATFNRDVLNITNEEAMSKHDGGTNILGLIVFSIMLGIAIRNLDTEASVLADFFHGLRRAMVYLVTVLMWLSPIGILSLIAQNIAAEEKLLESLGMLSLYVATVMTGLVIHGVIILPFLLHIFTRRSPLKFTGKMLQALMCAAGTASSTATLPCTVKCLEQGASIDPRVTRFMLPLGTTINMDGTVMYEAIAVIYIAQRMQIDLALDDILMIGLAATLAGMAAASMPSAGIVTMAMVLMAVGIPTNKTEIIIAVDWFLDRFRTMVNVYGDAVGAAIISKLCESKLTQEGAPNLDELPDPEDAIVEYPGGLHEIDIENMTDQMPIENTFAVSQINGDVCRIRSRAFSHAVQPDQPSHEPPAACVYVIDEDTVVLKF